MPPPPHQLHGQAAHAEPGTHNAASNPAYSDSNPRIRQLVDWFTGAGGWLHPDVRIVQDEAGGFHVIACSDSDTDGYQLVAKGHIRSTLSYLNLDHTQDAVPNVTSPLQRLLGKIPNHILTYLFLVEQRILGDKSPWEHYIACLPVQETMTTPLFFSEEDAAYMKGTPVYNSLSAQKTALFEEWEKARSFMVKAGLSDEAVYQACDFESYLWAVTIITSRAFISQAILPTLPKFSLLFPVIDLLDHSPTARAQWDFTVRDSFSLKLSQPFRFGAELFNNYGPKHNGELLYGYGFAIPNNPVEQIHLKVRFGEAAQWELAQFNKPGVLPFDLDPQLCEEPFDNDLLFRPNGSPLGRYRNRVPCLAACPPQYVLSNYQAALRQRVIRAEAVQDPSFPGTRITLATIKPFYAFIQRRLAELSQSRSAAPSPQNKKQRFASIYRDGQLKVVRSLHDELSAHFNSVRTSEASQKRGILTTTEALKTLKQYSPEHYENFKTGVRAGWPNFDVEEDIDALAATAEEFLVWALLLVVMHAVASDSPTIGAWLVDIIAAYRIPRLPNFNLLLDDEDEDLEFLTQVVASAVALGDETWKAVNALPKLDLVITWALRVARCEMLTLPDLQNPQLDRHCLYMSSDGDNVEGEEPWILKDVEVGDWRDIVLD